MPVGEYLKSKHKEKIPQIENTCTLKDAKALTGGELSMVTREWVLLIWAEYYLNDNDGKWWINICFV